MFSGDPHHPARARTWHEHQRFVQVFHVRVVLKTIGKSLCDDASHVWRGLHSVRERAGGSLEVCRDGGALCPDGCRPGPPMFF